MKKIILYTEIATGATLVVLGYFWWSGQDIEPVFALVALVLCFTEIYRRTLETREQETESKKHSRALELRVSNNGSEFDFWVSNNGTHVVTAIEIAAIPDTENKVALPILIEANSKVDLTYPIEGGWWYAQIDQITPKRGFAVGRFALEEGNFTTIDVDVRWLDHEGMQRKGHGLVDVSTGIWLVPFASRDTQ